MSRNLSINKRENRLQEVLSGLDRQQSQVKSIQHLGSESLLTETVWGYQVLSVPANSSEVSISTIDITAVDTDKVMVATLTRSSFIKYTNGTYINADLESHGIGDDVARVWFSYDGRSDTTVPWSVPPSAVPVDDVMEATAGTSSIDYHRIRVNFTVYRLENTAPPANLELYLIAFQVRLILG